MTDAPIPSTIQTPATPTPAQGSERREPPDKGSRPLAVVGWLAALVLLGVVIVLNQFGDAPAEETFQHVVPENDAFGLSAKTFVKLARVSPMFESSSPMFAAEVAQSAKTPEDHIRAAIVNAELDSPEAGLKALDRREDVAAKFADTTPHPDGEVSPAAEPISEPSPAEPAPHDDAAAKHAAQIETDKRIVRSVLTEGPLGLTSSDREAFEARYGWFARLALARELPPESAERREVLAGGGQILAAVGLALGIFFVALVGGLTAFVVMLTGISRGQVKPAFVPPTPGGSIWIETAAIFIGSFVLLRVGTSLLAGQFGSDPPAWVGVVHLGAQWLLALVPLYPLVRGLSKQEWSRQIGLHTGRGFFREVGAGIYGYFAALPVLAAAMAVTVIIIFLRSALSGGPGGEAPAPPDNPIVDILSKAGPLELALLFSLAVVWAPLVEESIFRGAIFRQVRGRTGLALAAIVSACMFGLMHGYDFFLLLPVTTIGFVFALMREWRGSLIPTITAHALHNGVILTLGILFLGGVR